MNAGHPDPPPATSADFHDGIPEYGLGVKAVSAMDWQLRTGLASLIAVTAAPGTVRAGSRAQTRRALEFYADLSRTRDPDIIFPAPPEGVPVRARTIGRLPWAPGVNRVQTLSFKSPYRIRYPAVADTYRSHRRNAVARAMHWSHQDGPRPTVVVVHGFTGSPYWLNSGFFSLPWMYGHGCDVVLAVLPFHGQRNDRLSLFSGSGMFSEGVATFCEAMFQSVCDLRVLIDYLQTSGVDKIGITGLSLGGYLTALMAEVDPRLHFAIPNCPVTEMSSLIDSWFPVGPLVKAGLRLSSVDSNLHVEAMSVHSPLTYPARLARDRLMIIGGLADRLAPPEQSARLWQHWDRPTIEWFPGNHVVHLGRAGYLRAMGHFLRQTGFSAG